MMYSKLLFIYVMQRCIECAQHDLQSEYWSHMLKSDYYIVLMMLALLYRKWSYKLVHIPFPASSFKLAMRLSTK